MMQLKTRNKNGDWVLIPTDAEFTQGELTPLADNMKRAGVAILEPNERVLVPYRTYTKAKILETLRTA